MQDIGRACKISVDGTDFRIYNQRHPRAWYSHKFRGPGVRYEVGICIQTGWIVWIVGPFRCGSFPDITIFRVGGLRDRLLQAGERAEADKGYRGEPLTIDLPNDGMAHMYGRKKLVRARHETCNLRFKHWGCMNSKFRHSVAFHGDCFRAIVVMVQLSIENGSPLFQVDY